MQLEGGSGLVFDVGGTHTRVALARDGVLGKVVYIPTDNSTAGFARFLGVLQEVAGDNRIKAVAGGFAGQLQGEDGEIVIATNLPQWLGLPMTREITALFDCSVTIANDVAMGGLGEATSGAGSIDGTMAYWTVSTGVNAVRLVNGVVDTTISRFELGKQLVDMKASTPKSLESVIGGAALEKRLGRPPHEIHERAVWAEVERYLAAGIYNMMLYWNPEVVVLGGRMMSDIRLSEVVKELEMLPRVMEHWPELRLATLGDEAGLRGAVTQLGKQSHK